MNSRQFSPHLRRPLAAMFSAWLALAPGRVLAEDTAADRTAAMQRQYREAHEAMRRKDWGQARSILLQLWNESQTYDVAASLAEAEYSLGNHLQAARHINYALDNVPPNERPETIQRLRDALRKVEAHLGTVHVQVNQSGAEILVDGVTIGRSPLAGPLYVEPGPHRIEAKLGDQTAQRAIDAVAAQSSRIELELAAAQPLAQPDGAAPMLPGGALSTQENPQRAQAPGKSSVPVYIGIGATALGLATWVGFGIAAADAREDAGNQSTALSPSGCTAGSSSSSACRDLETTIDRQRGYATVSNVGMGVAIVGGAMTLGYILFWPTRTAKVASSRFVPSLSLHRSGASASVGGVF